MNGANMNMEDPGKQEQIRRGPHEYVPTAGKHGAYVPKPYKHQEYPKMMLKEPKPRIQDFQKQNGVIVGQDMALKLWQDAVIDWDRRMTASIVNSKAEENTWLKQNA